MKMTKSECSTSQQQNRNNNGLVSSSTSGTNNDNLNYTQCQNGSYRSIYRNYHNKSYYNNHYNGNNAYNNNYHYYQNHHRSPLLNDLALNLTQLNNRQVERLRSVLQQNVEIHGRENFPTLKISLQKFIVHVKRKIEELDLHVKHVKLNGGAASYVLATTDNFAYSDVDLIFPISLATEHDFDKVRTAVFDTLLELMPESTNRTMICSETLKDIYIRKMIRVLNNENDRWSLFSLHNHYGRCIELKFVDNMRRQFEFSVDSFQITLDRLLENVNESKPIIKAESMYGDFCQALSHLNKRLIDTRNPEEIRGGGLLKYCYLLTRGYRATYNCREMEKYMCSRFFIDFFDINAQEGKLCAYLDNHFGNELQVKLDYLYILYRVIKESTICLMGHERRQTLCMVEDLRNNLEQMSCYVNQDQMCVAHSGTVYYNTGVEEINNGNGYPNVYYMNSSTPTVIVDPVQASPISSPTPPPLNISTPIANSNSKSTTSIDSAIDTMTLASSPATSPAPIVTSNDYVPRQTLLYFPPNGTAFELVRLCQC